MSESNETLLLEVADPELRRLLIELVNTLTGVSDTNKRIEMLLDSAIASVKNW